MELSFSALSLPPALLKAVAGLGYEQMTPIQAASIPRLLEGRDLIGQSHTGSGKTAAFVLPILARVSLARRALSALVLCPTRELSAQVAREFRKLGQGLPGLQVLVLAGGEPLRPQALALERGVHLAVGTPGRILDHLGRRTLELALTRTVVLDEADRMLDMGFADAMQEILDALPRPRQTVFFSATFPSTIETLSRKYQQDPVRVSIAHEQQGKATIDELVMQLDAEQKPLALRSVLAQHPHESALVFTNFKATVATLEKALRGSGVSVGSLHGDLEQFERDQVLAKFRNASTRVLIATDVAARGIDVESLDLVVNYDLPSQAEVYIHRIGRTGRAGKAGLAISFASAREKPKLKTIEQLTQRTLARVPFVAPDSGQSDLPAANLPRAADMTTLKIAGGRKQKMRPGDILGALTGEAGQLPGSEIGKIEIHDNFSYVAVRAAVGKEALKRLSQGRIKGKRFVVTQVK
jgi:ATP-independent RNA helicase DbpA